MSEHPSTAGTTCWTLIRGAAAGTPAAREEFVRRYRATVEACLGARWRRSALRQEVPDAVQDVFLECFKDGGALGRAQRGQAAGFRGFLYGVSRNVASRYEERRTCRPAAPADADLAAEAAIDERDAERTFLRSWAEGIMAQAAAIQAERAGYLGPEARQRIEILRLRFEDDLPVREIATRLGVDPERVHRQYALARREFYDALREVVTLNAEGGAEGVDQECRFLLSVLGD